MMTPSANSRAPSGYAAMHRQLGTASPAMPSSPLPQSAPASTPPELPPSPVLRGARPGWQGSTLASRRRAAVEGADARRRCCARPGSYAAAARVAHSLSGGASLISGGASASPDAVRWAPGAAASPSANRDAAAAAALFAKAAAADGEFGSPTPNKKPFRDGGGGGGSGGVGGGGTGLRMFVRAPQKHTERLRRDSTHQFI